MIKLEDVSTNRLMSLLKYHQTLCKKDQKKVLELYYLLQQLDAKTYGDIEKALSLLSMLDGKLKNIKGVVERQNEKGKEPVLYTFDTFKRYNIDAETISKTDNNNKINDLLINNPARGGYYWEKNPRQKEWSIAYIKFLLGHLDESKMKNAFMTYARGFGEIRTQRIVNAINLYDKVLARQYRETGKRSRGENLLNVDYDQKSDIVSDYLNQMTECLVDSSDSFIWGELTGKDKLRLMEAVKHRGLPENEAIICNLIGMFTNYSTLNELKQGPTKPKTLRKFIVK